MSFFSGGRRQQDEPEETGHRTSQPPRKPVGFETVLGANSVLNGALSSQANVRLDGSFEGSLEINGNVLVGETGKIIADINAKNIVIAGSVRGNVNGNKVQLLRTSRVWGDISAAAITTEEGAFIDGKITMVKHEAANQTFELNPPAHDPELSAMAAEARGEKVVEELEVVIGEAVDDEDD